MKTEMNLEERNLSEKEEMLLLKFHDGECGYFERIRVKGLLKREEARRFLESMCGAMDLAVKCMKKEVNCREASQAPGNGIWNLVSRRIEEEEKTAVLLGERKYVADEVSHFDLGYLFSGRSMGLGLAGGLAMAVVAVFIVPWGKEVDKGADLASLVVDGGAEAPSNSSERVNQDRPRVKRDPVINLVSSNASTRRPRVVFRRYYGRDRNTVEVDWMKSDGRVKVIQSPSDRAGIIWVNRNTERSISNTAMENSSGDEIRILDEHIPDTLPAFGSRYSSR